jgi:glycosyltransferase involved in cell wall biosynthesis
MTRGLHIAWTGAGPPRRESGGAPGVATELLDGLARLGHRIDCFLPGMERELPARLVASQNLAFVWGTSGWKWNRWYSRTKLATFASGLLARGFASLRLRREITRRHREEPYDLVLQFSNIESLAVPRGLASNVPVVLFPSTHMAGELRWVLAERRLSFRCQPPYVFITVATIRLLRTLVQRRAIRRARLLVCMSTVFRDHLVNDYRYPVERTAVIPYPVRLQRFADLERKWPQPPTILVLGRVAVRKGVEDVVAVAKTLLARKIEARVRVVGGPDLSSDYTKLLEDLPPENAEYVGGVPPAEIPSELSRATVLLQASKYEPFGLTVAEALAAGVVVVATSEVGAIEGVDSSVAAEVRPGDVDALVVAIVTMLERVRAAPDESASRARAEAERLFAPTVVCQQVSDALVELVDRPAHPSRRQLPPHRPRTSGDGAVRRRRDRPPSRRSSAGG